MVEASGLKRPLDVNGLTAFICSCSCKFHDVTELSCHHCTASTNNEDKVSVGKQLLLKVDFRSLVLFKVTDYSVSCCHQNRTNLYTARQVQSLKLPALRSARTTNPPIVSLEYSFLNTREFLFYMYSFDLVIFEEFFRVFYGVFFLCCF